MEESYCDLLDFMVIVELPNNQKVVGFCKPHFSDSKRVLWVP